MSETLMLDIAQFASNEDVRTRAFQLLAENGDANEVRCERHESCVAYFFVTREYARVFYAPNHVEWRIGVLLEEKKRYPLRAEEIDQEISSEQRWAALFWKNDARRA